MIPGLGLLDGFFKAVGGFFSWLGKRQELNNSPEMQGRDTARKDAKINDEISKDIADGNEETFRNRLGH